MKEESDAAGRRGDATKRRSDDMKSRSKEHQAGKLCLTNHQFHSHALEESVLFVEVILSILNQRNETGY